MFLCPLYKQRQLDDTAEKKKRWKNWTLFDWTNFIYGKYTFQLLNFQHSTFLNSIGPIIFDLLLYIQHQWTHAIYILSVYLFQSLRPFTIEWMEPKWNKIKRNIKKVQQRQKGWITKIWQRREKIFHWLPVAYIDFIHSIGFLPFRTPHEHVQFYLYLLTVGPIVFGVCIWNQASF